MGLFDWVVIIPLLTRVFVLFSTVVGAGRLTCSYRRLYVHYYMDIIL